mgnify:CR=1 FL=1
MKKNFKHLVVIGHPDEKSFCYNGIFKTIKRELQKHDEEIEIIAKNTYKQFSQTVFEMIYFPT